MASNAANIPIEELVHRICVSLYFSIIFELVGGTRVGVHEGRSAGSMEGVSALSENCRLSMWNTGFLWATDVAALAGAKYTSRMYRHGSVMESCFLQIPADGEDSLVLFL